MLIGLTLMVLVLLTLLNVILGGGFVSGLINVSIDNEALVNGSLTTYIVEGQDVLFEIDPLIYGIAILIAIITVASIIGVQVVGSGLSPQSVRIIVFAITYSGLWATLSILSVGLILSIETFGTIIYFVLTIAYTIGVFKKIAGGVD